MGIRESESDIDSKMKSLEKKISSIVKNVPDLIELIKDAADTLEWEYRKNVSNDESYRAIFGSQQIDLLKEQRDRPTYTNYLLIVYDKKLGKFTISESVSYSRGWPERVKELYHYVQANEALKQNKKSSNPTGLEVRHN